ncbi:MAG: putative toxin-antitoxin system toxin component, PIN family [Candidatus Bathyarchaeota archaeon]|nr:putative toxin-antitoxin system toxin component, PIN family [Candidatus Termiticorpusculum sp.]
MMFRIVFDTNVLISAILSDGAPSLLLRKGMLDEFTIVTSDLLLREFENVMQRPKFKVYNNDDEVHRTVQVLMQVADFVVVTSKFSVVERDFKDNIVLETAYDGKVDFIVSGDDHLLSLKSFRGIKIVSVKEMLDYLKDDQI